MPSALSGQKVLVFGLAKSGVAAIRLLLAQGAQVTALDARDEAALGDVARELKSQGVTLVTGAHATGAARGAVQLVVVSPGVPLALPELQAAREAGIPVWGEVELAWRCLLRGAAHRHHRHQRQEHHHGAHRRALRARRRPHLRGRQPRAAARRGGAEARGTGTRWWWSSPASSSRASTSCAPRARPSSTSRRTTSIATRATRPTARPRRASSSTRAWATSRW